MTKENFEKFDKTKDIFCECCQQNKPTLSFNYRNIKTNIRSANRCKACDWLYRNYEGKIPNIKNFTHDEILQTISFIFDNNNPILNELSFKLNRTIDELIELIYALNLKNVPLTIQSKCACCEQNINSKISVYLNRKIYIALWNAIGKIKLIKFHMEKIVHIIIELLLIVLIVEKKLR